ncbi:MAG: hypothetical protein ACLQMF_02490 [Rectinemataceae bacterium]
MPRPKKDVRLWFRRDLPAPCYCVQYIELPGRWIVTHEATEERALAWARRNRARLNAERGPELRDFAAGIFDPAGEWVRRRRAKGHAIGAAALANHAGRLRNHIIPEWGERELASIHRSEAMTRHYRHPDAESLLRAGLAAREALDKARG